MSEIETKIAENIRDAYTEKKKSKLNELMELDRKAKRPAEIFAIVFGVISSLILGIGMCLAMKVIPQLADMAWTMPVGIVVGLVGIGMCVANYFIYKAMVKRGKAKYAERILTLSNEILGE